MKTVQQIMQETNAQANIQNFRYMQQHYTPDFFITYQNGTVEAVEVKSAAVRKLQRDYIYRRRLFIERFARPNGWRFTEYIQE
ncbi:MAG TPA: Tn7 transposase TnsA N-terminal domain-containing protein [Candidatus Gemmiger avistercoris]|uniref:Tn7 transposase TnsA N-terminal domain-containing protein n=1 Tax=Candidatus Gemmiger avistercoris TaxID=2838606 RepID=A0A9D2JPR3_9FIRM|nr:TnsA endonuclease N-terminal domain-containing protein [uncultured Subdoligranulum sp.]HIZ61419.1 Tn7 transposase TnsA N-terminal domain-containing protein [Candidatus Gemmiger avistercoris]